MRQGRNVAVQITVEIHSFRHLPAVGLETTVEIAQGDPGERRGNGIEHLRFDPLDERILPVLLPPAHQVGALLVEGAQEARDLSRVILEVGVHGEHHLASGNLEARLERGRLAELATELDQHHLGIGSDQLPAQCDRAIGAAVVDHDDLVGPPELGQHPGQLLIQLRQAFLLVQNGDDDGDIRVHVGPSR